MTRKRNTGNRKTSRPVVRSRSASGDSSFLSRRRTLIALGAVAIVAAGGWALFFKSAPTSAADVVVYKNPTCGCCSKWADHMRAKGFTVEVKAVDNIGKIKEKYGIPPELESCHTSLIDGYIIEGHVPVREVNRLLTERPDAKGIAVAGMPAGSPGMEGRYTDRYKVMLFRSDGSKEVYARY